VPEDQIREGGAYLSVFLAGRSDEMDPGGEGRGMVIQHVRTIGGGKGEIGPPA